MFKWFLRDRFNISLFHILKTLNSNISCWLSRPLHTTYTNLIWSGTMYGKLYIDDYRPFALVLLFFGSILGKALQWNAILSQRGLIKGLIPLITQMNLLNGRSPSNYIRDKRRALKWSAPCWKWEITALPLLWLCFKRQPCGFPSCRWVKVELLMSESNAHLQRQMTVACSLDSPNHHYSFWHTRAALRLNASWTPDQ